MPDRGDRGDRGKDAPRAPHASGASGATTPERKPRKHDTSKPAKRAPESRDTRRALGAEGEDRAAAFLGRRGYRIVERNVRPGGVEVDLIARRGRLVVFVEVKTRRSNRHGAPELAVDGAKQHRLVRAATAWLHGRTERAGAVRFDVIACTAPRMPGDAWQIDHLPGAFDASG
jgi:putative endonuclease